VGQNASFGLSIRGESAGARRTAAREVLARVGLTEAIDKRPDELSGGMRQRVAVARALAMRPKVLLMDEPFAALDVQTRAKMQDFLLDVWRDSSASVLFVTHHIDEAVALADRVVVFTSRPGRIKTIVPVDIPRPRDPFSPEAELLRRQLTELMRDEVDRAFASRKRLPPPPDQDDPTKSHPARRPRQIRSTAMSISLIRSRAIIAQALDRQTWQQIDDGAVLQETASSPPSVPTRTCASAIRTRP